MYQHLPAPMMHQILHITMVMRCYTVLEQKWHHAQAVLVFKAKSWPHLILQEYIVKLVAVYHTNWYGMVMHKSISNEEHDMHDFQSTLTVLCNFLPRWHLGTKFNILSFQMRVKRMHPPLVSHYYMTKGWTASFLQCCRWVVERGTHLALWSLLNMCQIHFAQTLVSQGCWQDMVNTGLRDSDFCSNCRAWNTVHIFKDRFHVPCGLHPSLMLGVHCKGHHLSLRSHS
jgi:hypothetical protein